jgi:FkbM family methyltransferase
MTSMPPISKVPFSFRLLTGLTRRLPQMPHASGIGNRIAKPLFCRLHRNERYRIDVWDGIEMIVNPSEPLGGYLAFVPQFYDVWERAEIDALLPRGGVFVDIGANIGTYSLWAARRLGSEGRVLAYEVEPTNFSVLVENVRINGFERIVQSRQIGVSDNAESLTLHLNDRNPGGHSLLSEIHDRCAGSITVSCAPLAKLMREADVHRVDVMKIDIEGFEQRVLSQFFADLPPDSPLRPRAMLVEMDAADNEASRVLLATINKAGYNMQARNEFNCLFFRRDV